MERSSKGALAELVGDQERFYQPSQWRQLQSSIRLQYTMEPDCLMFDAILQGKSIQESLAIARCVSEQLMENDDIELF